ncbi:hypothetical protein MN113_21185 [Pseudomonas veronii]|jgi:hypothetical protein|uniref:YncE family protein n=1 Tax=Pseudomonas veronii TaxID=76761 RepID=UPI0021BF9A83|nr:hypothetical protein [Pseudomonas veronii]MCT8963695.1 hypothetical protein [Pseudomonas veronii]
MNLENDLTESQSTERFPIVARSQAQGDNDEKDIDLAAQQHLNRAYFSPPQPGLGSLVPGDFINTPLANLPAYIPGLTQNVQSHDGGINKAALDVHREDGLLFNLLPYLGWAAGDFCELFWGDLITPVTLYTIRQDDIDNNRIVALYVPPARIIDGSISPVFIRVTPVGGNAQETKRFNFKVDTVRPGGRNPVASTLQNENLPKAIFPQNIIDFGVSEKDAQDGVQVTFNFYPVDTTQPPDTHRAARDRIRFSVGGVFADIPPITEGQAAGRQPITITLYYGFWQQVGSSSRVCEYEVIDECGNASDGWSPAQLLNVQLNDGAEPLLPEPYFDEAPEDILDHDSLDGQDATIVVAINRLGYNVGDIIRVTVKGRTVDGTQIITSYDSAPLTSTTVRQITLPCPNADLRKLIGGRLQLSYVRVRANSPDRTSDSILVTVIGTPIETDLARPIIVEANGGILDPQLLTVTVDIRVYDGRDPFDLVTLILDGTYPNGDRYYNEFDRSAGTGIIRFQLRNGPNGDIAKLEGGSLRFLYRVTNADGTRVSLDEIVQIGNVSATLPEPLVAEAPAPQYQFDPTVHLNDAAVTVPSNRDFLEGDTVTLYCIGTAAGGTQPEQAFPILRHWVGRDLPFTLERRYITPNLDRSMKIYYEHSRPTVATRTSIAVDMKVGSRRQLKVPRVVEATVYNEKLSIINPLHVLPPNREEVTIRVTVDGFPASANIKVFIVGKPGVGAPDIPEKPARPDQGENYVSFTVPSAFLAAYLGGECTVFYYLIEFGQSTKSDELTLEVEDLSEQHFELVSIPEASGGAINTTVANNVRIDKWPFFKTGEKVWIYLTGALDLVLRPGTGVTPAEFSAGRTVDQIPRTYLDQLKHGDVVKVKAYVSLDGTGEIDSAVSFKEVSYSASALNLRFVNTPYIVGPDGTLNNVELTLGSDSRSPSAIVVTIPTAFRYADGSTGAKAFLTDENGVLAIPGIRGPNTAGSYTFTATSGSHSANTDVLVKQLLPAGSVINLRRGPAGLVFLPNNLYFYATLTAVGAIVKIDSSSGEVLKEIDMGMTVRGIYCSHDGKKLYLPAANSIIVVDTSEDKITNTIPVNGITANHTLDLSPDGKYIFTISQQYIINSSNILRISTASETLDRAYRMSSVYTNFALCSADSTSFYTMDYQYGYLYRVNIESGAVSYIYSTGSNDNNMILSPDRSLLYINNWTAGSTRLLILELPNLRAKSFTINLGYAYCMSGNRQNTRLLSASDATRVLMDTLSGANTRRYTIAGRGASRFGPDDETLYHCEEFESRISVTSAP